VVRQEYLHRYQAEYLATIERRLARLPQESIPAEIARIKREIQSGTFRLFP
jgi:hypothetical protein